MALRALDGLGRWPTESADRLRLPGEDTISHDDRHHVEEQELPGWGPSSTGGARQMRCTTCFWRASRAWDCGLRSCCGGCAGGYRLVMVPSMALLPSPLLGPSVWQPVARILAGWGWHTTTGAVTGPVRTVHQVLDALLAELPAEREYVLVPHSNAGAYVPALVEQRRAAGVIFVDAVLPPRRGSIPLAPPAFLDLLRAKADDEGLLPVWTGWWDEDISPLFPDPDTRARVEREQRQFPLSYFETAMPVQPGWDDCPAAYLAFGDTYAAERDEAARRHWPVKTVPGEHLHQLIDPRRVAAELVTLVRQLGVSLPQD